MPTDRSWINCPKLSTEFGNGVDEFMKLAYTHVDYRGLTRCPCMKCCNMKFQEPGHVRSHIYNNGFQQTYRTWYNHGESYSNKDKVVNVANNDVADMLADIFAKDPPDSFTDPRQSDKLDGLFKDTKTPLYPGCKNYSTLNFLVKLMHLKVTNKWSNYSFESLLELLVHAMPDGTILPKSHYDAKAKLRGLRSLYESIDVCQKDMQSQMCEVGESNRASRSSTSATFIQNQKFKAELTRQHKIIVDLVAKLTTIVPGFSYEIPPCGFNTTSLCDENVQDDDEALAKEIGTIKAGLIKQHGFLSGLVGYLRNQFPGFTFEVPPCDLDDDSTSQENADDTVSTL